MLSSARPTPPATLVRPAHLNGREPIRAQLLKTSCFHNHSAAFRSWRGSLSGAIVRGKNGEVTHEKIVLDPFTLAYGRLLRLASRGAEPEAHHGRVHGSGQR